MFRNSNKKHNGTSKLEYCNVDDGSVLRDINMRPSREEANSLRKFIRTSTYGPKHFQRETAW
jgi:hypothetical protein